MADCMKYARHQQVESADAADTMWTKHITFYNTLFPILDALADLEAMINREDKNIEDLSSTLAIYGTKITDIYQKLTSNHINFVSSQHFRFYSTYIDEYFGVMSADLQRFYKNIENNNNPQNTQAFFWGRRLH